MVLTPDVDAPVASTVNRLTTVEDMNTEMHCYESCIDKNEVDTDLSSHVIERPLLLSVVKQMAILGFNAILLIADTRKRFNDMQATDICQKLLIAQSDSDRVDATDVGVINHISDVDSVIGHSIDNRIDSYRNVVSSILTSMTIAALNGVLNSEFSDANSDELVVNHPISLIEGAVDPLSYTLENGKFHIVKTSTSSNPIDNINSNKNENEEEDDNDNEDEHDSNYNISSSSKEKEKKEQKKLDLNNENNEVNVNGEKQVRSQRRSLRIFSIRLWS